MRRRYQKGSLRKVRGKWIGQWWENGHRRKQVFGSVAKSEAWIRLDEILALINAAANSPSPECPFKGFVENTFLPWYERRWKRSTIMTNEDRIKFHLLSEFATRPLGSFTRDDLQGFLDRKAEDGLSYSVVSHLRWDLRQIFGMAVTEGYLARNPAAMLFTPRDAKRYEKRFMTIDNVRICFTVLDLRERLIVKSAILAGLRPGEILGLRWGCVFSYYADVRCRVYRGDVDSPKTSHSVRRVALPGGLAEDFEEWRSLAPDTSETAWVFPSENPKTAVGRDNLWRRQIHPKLEEARLGWVNFQVMRRTHASLMNGLAVDPKIVAEQMGHTLDVNLNVYTNAGLERRWEAVNRLESVLLN